MQSEKQIQENFFVYTTQINIYFAVQSFLFSIMTFLLSKANCSVNNHFQMSWTKCLWSFKEAFIFYVNLICNEQYSNQNKTEQIC